MIVAKKNFYNYPTFWIGSIIVFGCTYNAAINLFNLPTAVSYLIDLMCVVLFLMLLPNIINGSFFTVTGSAGIIVFFLLIESFVGYLGNLYSPLTYIWGIRTLFRFMVFYLGCIYYLDRAGIEKIFKFLYYVLLLSVPVTTVQYALGYEIDSVTGFFSQGQSVIGGSAGQNMLMVVVCTYVIMKYFNGKISLIKMLLPLLSSVYMAAIGELKFFYFELIIIAVLCCIFLKMSLRKTIGLVGLILVIAAGLVVYNYYYGGGYYYTSRGYDFFSIEAVEEYIGLTGASYGSYNSLNRTTALPYVWDNFLTDFFKKLFGMGLGYADNFSSSLFSSGFLDSHQGLGYSLWTASLELANIGFVGLGLCFSIFIASFFTARKMEKVSEADADICAFAKIISIISIIMMFYNQSLILDITAPIMFFSLSIPYIIRKEKMEVESNAV